MMVKAQYSQPPCCCCNWKILENKTLPVCMLKLTFGFVFLQMTSRNGQAELSRQTSGVNLVNSSQLIWWNSKVNLVKLHR